MMHHGERWAANLHPPRGHEIAKAWSVLAMQTDELGPAVTPVIAFLPWTTQVYRCVSRWRFAVPAPDRLLKPCQVATDQPRSLDRERFGDGHHPDRGRADRRGGGLKRVPRLS